jgi:c-di-GMP-binding flagellar brake protein YcgR
MEIGMYQNMEVANFSFVGKSVEMKMFERFRERKYYLMNRHRFAPHPYIDYNFSLKGSRSQQYLEVSLQDISSGGFSILLPVDGDMGLGNEDECDFLIYSKSVGFISGRCVKVWQKDSPASRYVGYRFVDLPENDDHRIKGFISKFFYQIEKREYFNQRCRE